MHPHRVSRAECPVAEGVLHGSPCEQQVRCICCSEDLQLPVPPLADFPPNRRTHRPQDPGPHHPQPCPLPALAGPPPAPRSALSLLCAAWGAPMFTRHALRTLGCGCTEAVGTPTCVATASTAGDCCCCCWVGWTTRHGAACCCAGWSRAVSSSHARAAPSAGAGCCCCCVLFRVSSTCLKRWSVSSRCCCCS